jgi:predicted transcriptional regulator
MQTQPTVDGTPTFITLPVVPQRSTRRAAARRASTRRATARQRKGDVEGRIIDYLRHRPQSTTGDLAKALNADRGTIAAAVSHAVRASEIMEHHATGYRWRTP